MFFWTELEQKEYQGRVHPTLRKEEDISKSYLKQTGCVKRQVNPWVTGCDWISQAIPCGRCFPIKKNLWFAGHVTDRMTSGMSSYNDLRKLEVKVFDVWYCRWAWNMIFKYIQTTLKNTIKKQVAWGHVLIIQSEPDTKKSRRPDEASMPRRYKQPITKVKCRTLRVSYLHDFTCIYCCLRCWREMAKGCLALRRQHPVVVPCGFWWSSLSCWEIWEN